MQYGRKYYPQLNAEHGVDIGIDDILVTGNGAAGICLDGIGQASLIRCVISCTNELVNQALQADWAGVLDGMETRRRLLQCVVDHDNGQFNPEVSALSTAVEESERALMRVIAHAIASSRMHGAAFALYH